MKVSSWSDVGLSTPKVVAIVVVIALAAGAGVLAATFSVLGGVSVLIAFVVGVAAAYIVASAPKRSLDRSALLQAREAPALAASVAVYLQSTGSRTKTMLMLSSGEPRLSALIERAKKLTLLGMDATQAFKRSEGVRADSTAAILDSVTRAHSDAHAEGGEELEGMVRASLSGEETKFPVFLTVSFFLPIMLMLLAAVGHHDDTFSVVSMTVVEVVILDLALSFTSTDRKRLSA